MALEPQVITDMRGWKFPGNRKRARKKPKADDDLESSIETSNSFEALEEEDALAMQVETTERPDKKLVRKCRIPPIVIYTHLKDHVKTMKELREELEDDIELKSKPDRIIMYTKNEKDYATVLNRVKAAQIKSHTYTLENKKLVTSIIKGLPVNIAEDDIKLELGEKNLKVIDVKQFIKKNKNNDGKITEFKLPIFRVKFEEGTKISDIKNVRSLCFCKVRWEKNFSPKLVTQCYKCQSFGHIATNCFRDEVCAFCAGNHSFKDCTVKSENYKCANCKANHAAVNTDCPAFKAVVERRNRFSNNDERPVRKYQPNYQNNDNLPNVQMSTPVHGLKRNYKEAVGGARPENHNKGEGDDSFSSFFKDIKSIFKDFNFSKISTVVKKSISNFKKCSDPFEKMMTIVEGIIEIFS